MQLAVPCTMLDVHMAMHSLHVLDMSTLSQPGISSSQSIKPAWQVPATASHTPSRHSAVPCTALFEQALHNAPQCAVSVRMLASQPLLAIPSQSANPAVQVPTAHVPVLQSPVPLGMEHPMPQALQLALVLRRMHPPGPVPSQSASPLKQVLGKHTPVAHVPPVAQVPAQLPQCSGVRVELSQPGAPVQSSQPSKHERTAHSPLEH